jgi:hypothetical protein
MPPKGAIVRRRGPAKSGARTAPYTKPSLDIPIYPKHGGLNLSIDGIVEDKENTIPNPSNASKESPANSSSLPSCYRDIPLAEIEGEVPVYENVRLPCFAVCIL